MAASRAAKAIRGALAGLVFTVSSAARLGAQQPSAYEQLQTFSGVLNYIRLNYVDSVTYTELVRAAIVGVLRSLDPHSYFESRRDVERSSALDRGELAVTGMALEEEDSAITVLAVYRKSPAENAGILPGDRVVQVNDTSVHGLKIREAALQLAGPKGSKVRVTLERGPRLEPDTFSVTLKRTFLESHWVSLWAMLDSSTGFLRLEEFGPKAAADVHDAIKHLQHSGARRVVLDVRSNPGGLVDQAVDVAAEFFPKGTLVFRTRGRKRDTSEDFVTKHDGEFRDLPVVMLINGRSASASEALAGSLQDHDRALIVGRRSFGKALEQTGFWLPTGDVVELTIARIYTPSGRIIQRRYKGIRVEQYWAFAGKSGADSDTTTVFRTDHGRPVRGGGGIVPDIELPLRSTMPAWWTVATDSGFATAVADSVAQTLSPTPTAHAAWTEHGDWGGRLLDPFLARVRSRLHVRADPDSAVAARIAVQLAARAADVRWPPDGGLELWLRNDPDIRAAINYFPRLTELLAAPQ
jgi:carboxyl-terminal processing protease